jgi:hypothetical protein
VAGDRGYRDLAGSAESTGWAEGLEGQRVGAVIDTIVSNPLVRAGLKRAWQERQDSAGTDRAKRVQQLEGQLQRARERIGRGTELLVDSTIERQAHDDLVAKAHADSESAENELAAARREQQPSRAKLPQLEQILKAAGSWTTVLQGAEVEP